MSIFKRYKENIMKLTKLISPLDLIMQKTKGYSTLILSLLVVTFLASLPVQASDELLEVDQAFVMQPLTIKEKKVTISWKIEDDYKLYKDKISVESNDIQIGSLNFSPAKMVDDPLFGKTEVFAKQASVTFDYESTKDTLAEITVGYQGCADKLGVCYPPQTRTLKVDLPATSTVSENTKPTQFGSLSALDKFLKQDAGQVELLDAEDAFQFSHQITADGMLQFNWVVAEDYHLYEDKLKTSVIEGQATLGKLQLPPSKMIDDAVFGKTAVFHGAFDATLPITNITGDAIIEVEYQGCSSTSGVCYPPVKKQINVNAADINTSATDDVTGLTGSIVENNTSDKSALSETDRITDTLINSSVWIVILTFFVFGLLLSLTPCVFPMIPILSSIIAGQGDKITTRKAFMMSLVYVLAMSITYTAAGVLAGIFGENLQVAFQNPWIIGSFSVVFLLLALSLFGFYEFHLPVRLHS